MPAAASATPAPKPPAPNPPTPGPTTPQTTQPPATTNPPPTTALPTTTPTATSTPTATTDVPPTTPITLPRYLAFCDVFDGALCPVQLSPSPGRPSWALGRLTLSPYLVQHCSHERTSRDYSIERSVL